MGIKIVKQKEFFRCYSISIVDRFNEYCRRNNINLIVIWNDPIHYTCNIYNRDKNLVLGGTLEYIDGQTDEELKKIIEELPWYAIK